MKNEVIITAKTVDEAMAQARRDYGSSENELAFEILEMPKKGFLGLGATPAKVKVTITKALGDVDLSDLVSSIRNMKITTDRGGEYNVKWLSPVKAEVFYSADEPAVLDNYYWYWINKDLGQIGIWGASASEEE